ncbi:hemin uptake protein HemP [Derxia gummosa]|uniref:Hemin uptake protein HemP n=1 Tax=Derxia gummosa DSM 723 TaxID=1121388 RepID=A0A8B6X7C9_9BURK|nr:hemin uptake protein HemP [Derxia gummosa]
MTASTAQDPSCLAPGAEALFTTALVRPATGGRRLSSAELFEQTREIEIEHNGAIYRLRITSMGRLILTK